MDIFAKDFDPYTLTKPQLRSTLGEHGVVDLPPANAKKDELVELLLDRVIRPAQQKQAKTTKKGSTKQSVRASSHGIEFLDGSGKVGSPAPPKLSDDEETPEPRKRGRPRTKKTVEESNFSDDNPFQSPARPTTKAKTATPQSTAKDSKVATVLIDKTPVKSTPKRTFTPLPFPDKVAIEALTQKEHKVLKFCNALSAVLKFFLRMTLLALVAGYVYFSFIKPFPFCDKNAPKRSIRFDSVGKFVESISNYCIPCPSHGTCTGGKLKCDDKYVEKRGLWFSSSCVIDKHKLSTLEDMLNTAKMLLNSQLGSFKCGQCESSSMTGPQLKKLLAEYKRPAAPRVWNSETSKFDEYWKLFVEEIKANASAYGITYKDGKLSGNEPIMPLKCRIILGGKQFVAKYQRYIFLSIAILVLMSVFRRFLANRNKMARIADEMIEKVIKRLIEQDFASRRNSTTPSALSISHLRDSLLVDLNLDSKTKKYIWESVYKIVSGNSNIREYVTSVRGEQHKVWEWIGNPSSARKEL